MYNPSVYRKADRLLVNSFGSILKNSRHDKQDKRGVATAIVVIASTEKEDERIREQYPGA